MLVQAFFDLEFVDHPIDKEIDSISLLPFDTDGNIVIRDNRGNSIDLHRPGIGIALRSPDFKLRRRGVSISFDENQVAVGHRLFEK